MMTVWQIERFLALSYSNSRLTLIPFCPYTTNIIMSNKQTIDLIIPLSYTINIIFAFIYIFSMLQNAKTTPHIHKCAEQTVRFEF